MHCLLPSINLINLLNFMAKIIGILLGLLIGLAILLSLSSFLTLILWLAWKFVAVAAFGAPALSFLQIWISLSALGVLLNLVGKSSTPKS